MFVDPHDSPSRLKALLYGDTNTGKTVTALSFPNPVVIDPEGGTEPYKGDFDFKLFENPHDFDKIMDGLDWLARNNHPFLTLVIDPITLVWEQIMSNWYDVFMMRRRGSKSHRGDFYDLQPGDWKHPKRDLKRLIQRLHMLDMNVICTAREKHLYESGRGDMMKIIGQIYDGEKSLKYEFDTILRLSFDEDGQRWVEVEKDRSLKRRFKKSRFKLSMDTFQQALGDDLVRSAKTLDLSTDDQEKKFKKLAKEAGLSKEQVRVTLGKLFGIADFKLLTKDQGDEVIARIARKKRVSEKEED